MTDEDKFLTAKQTAALTSLPLGTIHSLVHYQQIPHLKIAPRTLRFSQREIAAWLESKKVKPAAAK